MIWKSLYTFKHVFADKLCWWFLQYNNVQHLVLVKSYNLLLQWTFYFQTVELFTYPDRNYI